MITYDPLWKLLIDRKMGKCHLRKAAHIAPNTLTKMRKGETISLAVLCRICDALNVPLTQIVEYIPDKKSETQPELT